MVSSVETLVSIIIPAYNSEKYIKNALKSVLAQTYSNWEAIIIDDCSIDNTGEIAKTFTNLDSRFKYVKLKRNSGAAVARNKCIKLAQGKFMAFLDSDDVWFENKLSYQINYMLKGKHLFTCTGYDKIGDGGQSLNEIVVPKTTYDYEDLLKNCPGNSTVIYNSNILGKHYIPDIKKRNDYVMWLQIIKESKTLHGLPKVLSSHRVRKDSISSKKIVLLKYHWYVYRKIEKLSIIKSIHLILHWIIKKITKF